MSRVGLSNDELQTILDECRFLIDRIAELGYLCGSQKSLALTCDKINELDDRKEELFDKIMVIAGAIAFSHRHDEMIRDMFEDDWK